jgi:hypothetical protein
MTIDDARVTELRGLRALEPDPGRGRRVQARCHATLARRSLRVESSRRPPGWGTLIDLALLGGLCVSYLLAILSDVLAVFGLH